MFPENNNQPAPQQQPMQQQPVQQQPQQPQYQQPAPQPFENTQQPAQQPQAQPQQQPVQEPGQQQPAPQYNDPNYIPAPGYGFMPAESDFVQSQQQQPVQPGAEYNQPQQQPVQQQPQAQPQQQPQQLQSSHPAMQQQPGQIVENISVMEQQFEAWLDSEYPLPPLPNIADVAADDPAALATFFNEYDTAVRARSTAEQDRREVRAAKDEVLWNEVFAKYGNLRNAPNVLQSVRQMYQGARAMGQAVTPLQVVDQYVGTLNNQYQSGYQANNTQVQIRQSQPLPTGGGNPTPPTPIVSQQDMRNLNQNGNDVIEDAAKIVAKMRAAGHGGFGN